MQRVWLYFIQKREEEEDENEEVVLWVVKFFFINFIHTQFTLRIG